MGVVIDQVVGRVEPEAGPGPAAGSGRGGDAAAPRATPATSLRRQLAALESRRLRLAAD